MCRLPPIPSGSGLAREDGGSACIHFECATAIASKLGSHRSGGVPGCAGCPPIPCGSEPAREDGGSASIHFECATAIASKLSSHRSGGVPGCAGCPPIPCGSGLAREDGGSACIHFECATAIASKLGSHRSGGVPGCAGCPQSPVGAGLLAKTVGQLASILNVLPPSRASSAPTGPVVCLDVPVAPNPQWERACSRWRSIRHPPCGAGPTPPRPAAESARPSTARGPEGRPGRPRGY